jgi:glycosyltransferase involved in cell wall biosynthesis
VGDGPALPEAKALAGELGLKNVCFDGFVEREEHPAIWREASFSVAPSIWEEPFGMVVLEAWKHGRPVLATDLGSFPEMVTDGEDGWLAPVDVAGFSEVLQRALDAGGTCAAMGRAGRNGLKSSFSRAAWLERITGYYRDAGLMKQ